MHHKRKRSKARRAGCLQCKPNKFGHGMESTMGHRGFGKLRAMHATEHDLRAALKDTRD